MIANYHTHTPRCRHARGAEESYIVNAMERGLEILGFSDHTPQWFGVDYYSTMRMFPQQLPEYCETVRQLKAQYQSWLDIRLGVEAEYYPAIFGELVPRLQDAGVEYMILGQHWVGNEYDAPYSGTPTEDEGFLQRYCDQVIAALETGKFTYLAHPDIVRYLGDRNIYERHMRRICRASIDTATPLEINFLGLATGRHYPNDVFWQLVGEEGCPVVLGIDAHEPEAILDTATEQKALETVEKYGLHLLNTVPLKAI